MLRKRKATQPSPTQKDPISSIFDLATPPAKISAFCQAVLKKIIPNGFWGSGDVARHNESIFLGKIDHFILLRRFEGMSLHEVMQGIKVSVIDTSRLQKLIYLTIKVDRD